MKSIESNPSSNSQMAVCGLIGALLLSPTPVVAQTTGGASDTIEEIVVTARKRDETLQEAPVVVSVFTDEVLDQFNINDVESLSDFTPGLFMAPTLIQGPSAALRGVSTPSGNMSSENSVSYVFDNVPVSTAVPGRFGQFDMRQVEVLKGPQSLFFGKNSTAGLLNFVSQDPSDEVEVIVKAGYEVEAEEVFGQLILSGPLSDTVKGRLAVRHTDMQGWMDNKAEPHTRYDTPGLVDFANGIFRPPFVGFAPGSTYDNGPHKQETALRGTLLWDPTDRLSARAKLSYSEREDAGVIGTTQLSLCSGGAAAPIAGIINFLNPVDANGVVFVPGDDCKVDNKSPHHAPSRAATDALLGPNAEAENFGESDILLGSLEINYDLSDELTLTSVTGLYDAEWHYFNQFGLGQGSGYHAADVPSEADNLTQELRITSSFDGAFNFMAGVYYEDGEFENKTPVFFPIAGGLVTPQDPRRNVQSEVWSVFAQAGLDLSDALSLSVGGRYTEDQKVFTPSVDGVEAAPQPHNDNTFKNFSPEITLTWQPTDRLNFFASYKQGFVSGGYQVTFVAQGTTLVETPLDLSYDEEEAEGFEVGAKTNWLDGRLQLNAAVYSYDFTDLQAVVFNPDITALSVVNAGELNTTGIEVDVIYLPESVEGLTLVASLSRNDAEFESEFLFECYSGQTEAQGCFSRSAGAPPQQDLRGQRPVQAPEIQAFLGLTYEFNLSNSTNVELFANASYSDDFIYTQSHDPRAIQESLWKTNAGVTLNIEDRWILSLVGKNLGDEYSCGTGGEMLFQAPPVDLFCSTQRGRQIWAEVEYRF